MATRKRFLGLRFAFRFILIIICTITILCSNANTTLPTDIQLTQEIQTSLAVTSSGTPATTESVGSEFFTATIEADEQGNQGTTLKVTTTEQIAGQSATFDQLNTKKSKIDIQKTTRSGIVDMTVRFLNESYSNQTYTADPIKNRERATLSKGNLCLPTPGGMNNVDERPHCNETDLNTVMLKESTRTSNKGIMTENTEINGYETTTVPDVVDYLSRLPTLCSHTNLCEKSTLGGTCCRACSCKPDCGNNCCFRNGTEVEYTGAKPNCMYAQRNLPGKHVSNYRTYGIVNTCRIPEIALFNRMLHLPSKLDESWKYKLSLVFSNKTNVTYYNMKYAKCNDEYETNIVYWDRIEFCASVSGQTYEDIHHAFLKESCDTVYKPPTQYQDKILECYNIDVDVCNVTGEWDYYDEQIEKGCKELRFPYIDKNIFEIHRKPTVFANVYCYICNNKRDVFVQQFCSETDSHIAGSFTKILSYTDEDAIKTFSMESNSPDRNDTNCGVYQIWDNEQNSCKNILCPIGSYRDANGHCVQFVKTMNKLAVQVAFLLRSVDQGELIDHLDKTEMASMFNVLKTKLKHGQLEWCFGRQFTRYVNDVRSTPVNLLYSINIRLHKMKSDSFSEIMRDLMEVPILLRVNGKMVNVSVELYHSALDSNMSPLYKFPDNIATIPNPHVVFKSDTHVLTHCQFTFDTHISKLTFCEQVILKRDDILPENTVDGSRIFVKSRNKYLYDFVVDFDNNIRICVDDFMTHEENIETTDSKGMEGQHDIQINLTKGVSFLGLFVDATFLTSAIVALCLCKELPMRVKLQNLQLVINLQLIQIFLLLSIILSITGTSCSVVGLCIHLLSLSVQFIAAMSFKDSSSTASYRAPLIKFREISFSVLKPHFLAAALVSISACFSMYHNGVGNFGYGSWKQFCFLTDKFYRIISFLVPICVATTVMVYTVLTTICRKERRRNSDTTKNLKYKSMHLCFCLLNLITWLSEYFSLDIDTSLIIFVLLNSIQCICLAICLVIICRRLSRRFIANDISMM